MNNIVENDFFWISQGTVATSDRCQIHYNRSHVGLELTSVACVAMLLVPDSGAFGRVCRLCAYIVFKNISPPSCYRYNLILMSNFLKI